MYLLVEATKNVTSLKIKYMSLYSFYLLQNKSKKNRKSKNKQIFHSSTTTLSKQAN